MNENNHLPTHNQTVPTTVGALLTEEWTIDPLSPFPSFLELTFVDVARNSGRRALSAAWAVGVAYLEGVVERLRRLERMLDRMASRMNYNNREYSSSASSGLQLLRATRALTNQLARVRVKVFRRLCHLFLRTVKTLGPELQTLIMYAIDYNCMHYLAGATACEMVYGLKRSKIIKARPNSLGKEQIKSPHLLSHMPKSAEGKSQLINQNAKDDPPLHKVAELTKFEKTFSALLAALLPYWKERCDHFYSEWKEERPTSPVYHTHNNISANRSESAFASAKEKFVQLYPYAHLCHEGSIFLYQFAYLMGYTPYWSFSLHALGVTLRRMTVADVQQQQKQQQIQQSQQQALPSPKVTQTPPLQTHANHANSLAKNVSKLTLPQVLRGAVLFSVSYTLLSGWYSHFQRQLRLRRRRWIAGDEEDESTSQTRGREEAVEDSRKRTQLPIPPPPLPPNLINEYDGDMDNWSCPICKEPRINPTASTSGYVFCYKCLVLHLRQNGSYCPVTGMPCGEEKVVRLYEPTASRRGTPGGIDNASSRPVGL